MNRCTSVLRIQFKVFMSDKGMLLFYLAGVVISGIAVPFFTHEITTSFTVAAFLTTMFLKPMLAESLAGERDKRTLESLLSTPIKGSSVLLGKLLFHLFFAMILFGASMACAAIINGLAGLKTEFALWQWISVIICAALNFTAIATAGTYLSAKSADMRTATGRVPIAAYPLGFLFIFFISVITLNQPMATFIIGGITAAIYICVSVIFGIKSSLMKQSGYYENIKIRKTKTADRSGVSLSAPKSQFSSVLQHEARYLRTIKTQIRLFIIFCFIPALGACYSSLSGSELFGLEYLDLTVIVSVLFIPSAIKNIVSYSVGGERAYKTGESLLSTPLNIRTIFLAKCALPVIVALIMIAASSILTLTGVNIISRFWGSGNLEFYSATQLTLLVSGGVLASIAMIFINGILSVQLKTPRNGLYVSTLLSMLLFAPSALITYNAPENALLWAVVYAGMLLVMNLVLLAIISGNIRRSWLMGRL